MPSIAQYKYPRVVWREGKKRLWNPIHRKVLKNRPEERVRLRIIEYLIGSGWSKHRISTEEAIGQLADTSMRTDIICYNQQFEPKILIECKSEQVTISGKTAEQVARYNQKVGAPYLLMTNGVTDFWYAIGNDKKRIAKLDQRPDLLNGEFDQPNYDFEDWKDRGFAGAKAVPELRKWFQNVLPAIWFPREASTVYFLSFNQSPSDLDLNHYYRIQSVSEDSRLAMTTMNTPYGGNRLVVIFNDEGENKAVLEINLDLLFQEKKGNSTVYSETGTDNFDLNTFCDLSSAQSVEQILEHVESLFDKYMG